MDICQGVFQDLGLEGGESCPLKGCLGCVGAKLVRYVYSGAAVNQDWLGEDLLEGAGIGV